MRLADRLREARHRSFVGRDDEISAFERALDDPSCPYCIIYLYGPGGVGKTTLLHEYAYRCAQRDVPSFYLDGRNVQPSPDGFYEALRLMFGLSADASVLDHLMAIGPRMVFLLDTYEMLKPIDRFVREVFLPELPDGAIIAVASHDPPDPLWRVDPGWQSLIRSVPVRNFAPGDATRFLERAGIEKRRASEALGFTHGHPLALSLVAEILARDPSAELRPESAFVEMRTLLDKFLERVPSVQHRNALEVASLVAVTTQPLLGELLEESDTLELFEWLRDLSFVDVDPRGLTLHDLAREILRFDLRWRNRRHYETLHGRARNYYMTRLGESQGLEQQMVLFDYVYLHRDNPVVKPFFEWQSSGLVVEPLRPADVPAVLDMVRAHEGAASLEHAKHWIDRFPASVLVTREPSGEVCGFLLSLPLHELALDKVADPAVRIALRYLSQSHPLRTNEVATYFRYWMDRDKYQSVSPTQSVLFLNMVRHYLTTPGLAFTFVPVVDTAFWSPVFAYADLFRIESADFEVDGRSYGVYGHDWRAAPPLAWLQLLADRETAGEAPPAELQSPDTRLVVLSEPDFALAVREALKNYSHPPALSESPLLRSRLVVRAADGVDDEHALISALRRLIRESAAQLSQSPKLDRAFRAVERTYIQPAPSQEEAAHILGMPFSTYRRHLKHGIDQITDVLWQRELNG
ncbi:MAG: AAA family ATPase [Myxococcales bacterium]|nr:AAA family ATPase [Myxococcales bacterium]